MASLHGPADGALAGVRVLAFDVLGTVVDWRSGIARAAGALLARHGAGHVDPGRLADAWAALYVPATEEVRSGRRPFATLDVLNRERLEEALAGVGVDPSRIPPGELDALTLAWHRLDPWPDSVEGLRRLKERFVVTPLSGANTSLLLDMARHAGLPWDLILGADVVGAYKPAPEAYLRTAGLCGARPDEVCLVAAHEDDLQGARACGMRTAFVPRPLEHGPGQGADLAPAGHWDVVAGDLLDLAQPLSRPRAEG